MNEDYPGADKLAANMRRRWPWISREQAWVLACIKIRPDRNKGATHIGWDSKRRPLIEVKEFGTYKCHAQLRNGNPTDALKPFTIFEAERSGEAQAS